MNISNPQSQLNHTAHFDDLKQKNWWFEIGDLVGDFTKKLVIRMDGAPKTEADKQRMEPKLNLWDEHAKGKINVIYERHIFNSYVQTDESLDDFIVKVKHYATNCDYGDLKDQLIRDRIVKGKKHHDLKQKLLNQEHTDLTLDKCMQMCKT